MSPEIVRVARATDASAGTINWLWMRETILRNNVPTIQSPVPEWNRAMREHMCTMEKIPGGTVCFRVRDSVKNHLRNGRLMLEVWLNSYPSNSFGDKGPSGIAIVSGHDPGQRRFEAITL